MAAAAIGIDIGGTHLRAARVSEGRIEANAEAPSSPDPAVVRDRCLTLVRQVTSPGVTGLGIGVPGRVDGEKRKVLSGGFVDLSSCDFAAETEAATGLPTVIENDAAMALLAEAAFGAAEGCRSVVMLTIGTGIGGAVLDRGRLLRGVATAGQLGHIVVEPNGRPCKCGRVGCLETVSSGTAFGTHVAEAGLPANTTVEDLLSRDDPSAVAVLQAWTAPLRSAVSTLVSVFNPDCVVLGGGVGAAAAAALDRFPESSHWYHAPVRAALLGDSAGVIGAAVAAQSPATGGKIAVLVNGVPASGKSSVARALSRHLGWPVLALDTIKAPFLQALPRGDRAFNRVLGRASYDAMFDVMAEAPAGRGFILDAWFGFQPLEVLADGLRRAGVDQIAEIWCSAPPDVIGARYRDRVGQRAAGHPGVEYVPELIDLATRAAPTGLAPCRKLDTEQPLDTDALLAWILEQGIH